MIFRYLLSTCFVIASVVMASGGGLNRYELDVEDFSQLKVIEGLNVDYKCVPDSAGKAVFTTSADMAAVMMFSNKKGRLDIQISTDGINYHNLPTITVYSNFLTMVENSGDSTVRVLSIAPGPSLKANLIGNGRLVIHDVNSSRIDAALKTGHGQLVINGTCTTAQFSVVGTGTIQADGLAARDVKCRIVGTGSIGCDASNELIILSGSVGPGKIYYAGSPAITTKPFARSTAVPLNSIGQEESE